MGLEQLENILDVREKLVYSLALWNPRNVGRREIITRYKQGPLVSVILLLAGITIWSARLPLYWVNPSFPSAMTFSFLCHTPSIVFVGVESIHSAIGVKGRDPFNQNSDRSDREKRTTSKGGPVFSKLFRLDRTDPLSFGPKFPEILVEWIALKDSQM